MCNCCSACCQKICAQCGQQSGSDCGIESEPLYLRYASLFNSYVGLLSAAEDSRPLLLIGMGARGMGPLRAALEWTPVQAHATANPVTLFYVAQGQQSAAYLADWDQWREAGVSYAGSSLFSSLVHVLVLFVAHHSSLLFFICLSSSCDVHATLHASNKGYAFGQGSMPTCHVDVIKCY